jgi:glutathione S-transferase
MTNLPFDRMAELQVLTARVLSSHNVGSWDEIRATLRAKQTPEEQNFRSNISKGYGKPSPMHKLRLFDKSNDENDVRVTLFRDSASWCPYCQKVWMTLEFKRIPYRIEKVNMRCYGDKPASFLRMQPSGSIPVAVIDGVTYNQSNDIMYALEEAFPGYPIVPDDPNERSKAQELLRLERTLFSAWMSWLTSGDSPNGRLRDNFISVLNQVDSELSATRGGFFLGEKASVVDFMFAPFLERMCASMLYFKGFQIRVAPGESTTFPGVNRWCVTVSCTVIPPMFNCTVS